MFSRRDILKYLGIGTATVVSGEVNTAVAEKADSKTAVSTKYHITKASDQGFQPDIVTQINNKVDELLRFYREATEVCPQLFPTATRLRLGCDPFRVYINVPNEVRRKVKAPNLGNASPFITTCVVHELWNRVKPTYIYELPHESRVSEVAADYFDRKRAGTLNERPNVLRPDRVNSPLFFIDRDEADEYSKAYMNCVPILIAKELHTSVVAALSCARDAWPDINPRDLEGDCWMTSITGHWTNDNNIVSMHAGVVSAGNVYLGSNCSDTETRRQEPWHWHTIPSELLKEAV